MRAPIVLALAGDVMLGRLVDQVIAERGFAWPWGNLLPVLRGADLFLMNLECALTAETERWHDGQYKAFYFRADPSVIQTLRIGRVDFASLANNHAGDFGTRGLLDTVEHLDRAGIAHAGAGANLAAAQRPALLTAGGWRIAVLACADYPAAWAASAGGPGLNYTDIALDPATIAPIERALAAARRSADLVVFSIHWGPNMRPRPTRLFRDFARRVIDSGADIFWGHSAHVPQGIEVWRDRLILYDTGDFVDDYRVDPELRNDLSALFLVRVLPPRVLGVELVPVHIHDMQVTLAAGGERDWFTRRMSELCGEMGTAVVADGGRLRIQVSNQEGA
jgi:poly-gamma-glutamate synthesis protein (capsule biosynthesis protein)